jgi:hypothetical protein
MSSKSARVRRRHHTTLSLTALLIFVSPGVAQRPDSGTSEGLITAAEVIAAVEIVSTDYSFTASDGPMVAVARVLKVLKGPLTPGREVRFSETAWVGPTYQKGEYRILFLEKSAPAEFPRAADWRIASRQDARTDFFIERDAVPDLSLQSLNTFLSRIATAKDRTKAVFTKGQ